MSDLLNFDPTGLLPGPPEEAGDLEGFMANVRTWARKMTGALHDYMNLLNTDGQAGFSSMTDGSNTQYASDNATLHLAGGDEVTVAYATGTLTFTVGDDEAKANALMGNINSNATTQINAGLIHMETLVHRSAGDSPPSSTYPGMLWYVTDATGDPTYRKWGTYRRNDADDGWELYNEPLYDTTITAGKIVLSTASNDEDWTAGATWGTDLSDIPTRIGDDVPSSGSGLVLTSEYLGFYHSGKMLGGSPSGTFQIGEKVIQTTSNAEGIVSSIEVNGIVVDVLSGTFSTSYQVEGQASGATMTPSNGVSNATAFGAVITDQGDFYFAGDGDNYIAWDGSEISIVCSGGRIGSTSNYFDITDGKLRITNTSDSDQYLQIGTEVAGSRPWVLWTNTSGSTVQYQTSTFLTMAAQDNSDTIFMAVGTDSNCRFYACSRKDSGVVNTQIILSGTANNRIVIDSLNGDYDVIGMNLKKCVVTTDTNATDGALRWDATNHKLQVYNSNTSDWETVTSS